MPQVLKTDERIAAALERIADALEAVCPDVDRAADSLGDLAMCVADAPEMEPEATFNVTHYNEEPGA